MKLKCTYMLSRASEIPFPTLPSLDLQVPGYKMRYTLVAEANKFYHC